MILIADAGWICGLKLLGAEAFLLCIRDRLEEDFNLLMIALSDQAFYPDLSLYMLLSPVSPVHCQY